MLLFMPMSWKMGSRKVVPRQVRVYLVFFRENLHTAPPPPGDSESASNLSLAAPRAEKQGNLWSDFFSGTQNQPYTKSPILGSKSMIQAFLFPHRWRPLQGIFTYWCHPDIPEFYHTPRSINQIMQKQFSILKIPHSDFSSLHNPPTHSRSIPSCLHDLWHSDPNSIPQPQIMQNNFSNVFPRILRQKFRDTHQLHCSHGYLSAC